MITLNNHKEINDIWAHLFTAIVVILPILIWNEQNKLTILNVLECELVFG